MGSITVEIKGFKVQFFWHKRSGVGHFRLCPRCSNRVDGKGKWSYDDSRSYIICGRCGERLLYNEQVSDDYFDEVSMIERALRSAVQQNQNLDESGALAVVARARVSALSME